MNSPTTILNLERNQWIQPGNVGDTGGGSATAPTGIFTMAPGTPTTPAVLTAAGAGPYNNGYFYYPIPGDWSASTLFIYELDVRFPTALDLAASQAIEWELQQNVDNLVANMAFQIDLKGSGMLRTFDYNASQWIATYIGIAAFDWTPGAWNRVGCVFRRDPAAKTLTHIGIWINGEAYPLNIERPLTPKTEAPYVHAAFQLDSGQNPVRYDVLLKNVNFTAIGSN